MDNRKEPPKFVPKSYGRSNDWAIAKVSEHLSKNGYIIINKAVEDYQLDIKAEKNGKIDYFECETKTRTFTGEKDYPYDSVSFLGRKKKWAKLGFWYVIVCTGTSACAMCHSSVIFRDEYIEVILINSQERKGDDKFYRVPKNLCKWRQL